MPAHALSARRVRALTLLALLPVFLVVVASAGASTIGAWPWDGSETAQTIGPDSTTTYGQTITGTGETLTSFSFHVQFDGFQYRAGVYEWEGDRAGTQLWLSGF